MSKKESGSSYISPWGYIGYTVLWSIPVLGWLIWLFNCFSGNINKRNFARSILCAIVFCVIVGVILGIVGVVLVMLGVSPEALDYLAELEILL